MLFQLMVTEGLNLEGDDLEGEVEIERVPTRTIELRSRHLIPVSDYIQSPKFHQARCSIF